MEQGQLNWVANFIWGIADDVLRDLYVRGKYRDVILPMTVLRRLDAVLEPTKQAVLDMKASLDKAGITNQDQALRQAAGQAFYNTSKFTLRDLKARASQQQLKADFEAYLDGFSPNVQDILDNFEFRNQIPRLSKADALGTLIEKFTSPDIDLSPNGLDNHGMGTVFEELVRRFNEENNEEAGEHWTPRDAVKLMAKLILLPVADEIESGTYLLYDGACGTGGMLTVAEETLQQLAAEHGKQVATHLYGQEINAETYAICKADLLLKGEGDAADNIVGGPEHSTLANDAFPCRQAEGRRVRVRSGPARHGASATARRGRHRRVPTARGMPVRILDEIGSEHRGRHFAIVIDEAHSSQGGKASAALATALSVAGAEEDDETLEDQINRLMEAREAAAERQLLRFHGDAKEQDAGDLRRGGSAGRRHSKASAVRQLHHEAGHSGGVHPGRACVLHAGRELLQAREEGRGRSGVRHHESEEETAPLPDRNSRHERRMASRDELLVKPACSVNGLIDPDCAEARIAWQVRQIVDDGQRIGVIAALLHGTPRAQPAPGRRRRR